MYYKFKPAKLVEEIDTNILDKYLGFSIYEIDDYIKLNLLSLKYIFVENKLDNVVIKIDQKNLYNLELQRKNKIDGTDEKYDNFSRATLKYKDKDYRIKLRVKGDRALHWYNKDQTSYKIDIRGPDRIWGLEEFSFQKPITRNYVYEVIFHKLLNINKLISLKYFFINLSINDTKQGIYAVEEGFSKELIERNKRRSGPIFGLDENKSNDYPYVHYDLYSKKYWIDNHPELTSNAIAKLNNLKQGNIDINKIFDLKKWATYFAIIDLSSTLHGSISKSVKLFYNPVTSKFEPIGFDAHYKPGFFENFLILDFLDPDNNNCSYICVERQWYLNFLRGKDGSLNSEFIELYIESLKKISSNKFIDNFYAKNIKEINFFNSQLESDITKKDRMFYKGLGYYIFDKNYLYKKAQFIQKKIDSINKSENLLSSIQNNQIIFDQSNRFFFKKVIEKCKNKKSRFIFIIKNEYLNYNEECKYYIGQKKINPDENIFIKTALSLNQNDNKIDFTENYDLENINGNYYLTKNIIIDKNLILPKNKKLFIKEGVEIFFNEDVSLISEGSMNFEGTKEKPILIYSDKKQGSVILLNNKYYIDSVVFNNLSFPKSKNQILYGGVNIVNSDVELINIEIVNSNSEDAINIISSSSKIKNIKLKNINSDAIDIDFGNLYFENISCQNITNDCLDVSGASVKGDKLLSIDVSDKGISFGENSKGLIKNTNFLNNKVGVAVKDGSNLTLVQSKLENNEYDLAIFNKKEEYGNSTINVKNIFSKDKINVLLGENNKFLSNQEIKVKRVKNSFINGLLY